MNDKPGAYRKRKKTPKMIKKQREGEGEDDVTKCKFLCGRIATGIIRMTEKKDVQLCDICHLRLDPGDSMAWIPF